ncbi:unnamed protein product, partial [Heterotrigona itama]
SNSFYPDNLISFHNFVIIFIIIITSLTLFYIDFITNRFTQKSYSRDCLDCYTYNNSFDYLLP